MFSQGYNSLTDSDLIDSASDLKKSEELALIYFGCSECKYANDSIIPSILDSLSIHLNQITDKNGISYTGIGISNERSLKAGFGYLTELHDFDELAFGNQMFNSSINRYIWRSNRPNKYASTPQIIIEFRKYKIINQSGIVVVHPELLETRIITCYVGINEMKKIDKSMIENEIESIYITSS